jgi:hypothetical protein
MRRRDFIALGSAAAAWPIGARAQQQSLPVVGFLGSDSPELYADRLPAFRRGLKDAGYIESENVAIEYRWANGEARSVEQGEIGFRFRQHRQQIGKRREDRETHAPAVAVLRAEQRHLPHDVGDGYISRELAMHGLGDHKAEVMGEAICEPLTPMRGGIGKTDRGLHPDLTVAQFDREDRYIVRPKIKGAAAFEIKASVVPMTGQDAVLNATALEREAHVWATIVEGEDAPAVVDDKDRTMIAVQNEASFGLQLLKATRKHEAPCSARP